MTDNQFELYRRLSRVVGEYDNISLSLVNNSDGLYIDVENDDTGEILCWLIGDKKYFSMHLPRLVDCIGELDRKIIKLVIDNYYYSMLDFK